MGKSSGLEWMYPVWMYAVLAIFLFACGVGVGNECHRKAEPPPPVAPKPEPKHEPERVRIIEKRDADGTVTTISEPAQRCTFDCGVCDALEKETEPGN